jgi:hypothetical protein
MQFWKLRLPTKIIKVENKIISGQKVWALWENPDSQSFWASLNFFMLPGYFKHVQKVEKKNLLCPNSLGTLKNPDA